MIGQHSQCRYFKSAATICIGQSSQMQKLLVVRALRCSKYLACVRGPDIGCVFPADPDLTLGRGAGLCDPYTEEQHLRFETVSRRLYIHDLNRVNPVLPVLKRGRIPVGANLQVGSNSWQVRERTLFRGWLPPKPVRNGVARYLRLLLPLLLLLGFARYLRPLSPIVVLSVALLALIALTIAVIYFIRRASLVGSEMCIRDRLWTHRTEAHR